MHSSYIYLFLVIIFILSTYLGFLLYKILKAKQLQSLKEIEYKEHFEKRNQDLYQSLNTLALVLIQDQVSIAEGCIRVKKLLDLSEELRFHEKLTPFHHAYNDFANFSYLDEYKRLSKQEKFNQDLKRAEVEQKHHRALKEASQDLKKILVNYIN